MGSKVQTELGNAAGEAFLPECWTQCVLSEPLLKGGLPLIGVLPQWHKKENWHLGQTLQGAGKGRVHGFENTEEGAEVPRVCVCGGVAVDFKNRGWQPSYPYQEKTELLLLPFTLPTPAVTLKAAAVAVGDYFAVPVMNMLPGHGHFGGVG